MYEGYDTPIYIIGSHNRFFLLLLL